MTAQKQSTLLLILICIFTACSEHDDPPLLDKEISKELVDGTAIEFSEQTEQKNPIETDVSPQPVEPVEHKGVENP